MSFRSLLLLAPIALLAATGCKSTGTDKAAATVGVMEKIMKEFAAAPAEVDGVVTSLQTLTSGSGDMRKNYDAYVQSVAKVESRATRLRSLRQDLDRNRADFTKAWEERLQTIPDEDLKARAQERREKVIAVFAELRTKGDAVREAYEPWLSEVNGVKKYLEFDLNPEGVASVQDRIASIGSGAGGLKTALGELNADFKRVADAIAVAMPPEPAPTGSSGT